MAGSEPMLRKELERPVCASPRLRCASAVSWRALSGWASKHPVICWA